MATNNIDIFEEATGSEDTSVGFSDEFHSFVQSRVVKDGSMYNPPTYNDDEVFTTEETEETISGQPSAGTKEINVPNLKLLKKNAETYELEKYTKNAMVIFNQENFFGSEPRFGTEADVEALERTFGRFDFEIDVCKDYAKDEIFTKLKTFSEQDFTDYGAVGVVVLTHGLEHGQLRAKDVQYSEMDIINQFRIHENPTLVTKPRFFIFQACRGNKLQKSVRINSEIGICTIQKDNEDESNTYSLPVEADMLVLHSSYAGTFSHRDIKTGSWFIQSLCTQIDRLYRTHDLLSIITEVEREVAIDRSYEEYNTATLEMYIDKQMPVLTSTLIRKLYLRRYGDDPPMTDACDGDVTIPVSTRSCACYLEHFDYLTRILRFHVDDNPDDETAINYLKVVDSFKNSRDFDNSKLAMLDIIRIHLTKTADSSPYFKYIHFYNYD